MDVSFLKKKHQRNLLRCATSNPDFSIFVCENKRQKQGSVASLLQTQLQNLGELLSSVTALEHGCTKVSQEFTLLLCALCSNGMSG